MDSDFVVGINKSIDAAKGETGKTYPAYLHNTLVTEKLDELAEAIGEGGVAHASIDELDDVMISNPQGGECLKYNATTQQWENGDDAGNVQSDWNENDPTSGAFILNKPTIPDISTKMDKSDPTGTGSLSLNRKANSTIGLNSVAEGFNCTASGQAAHAEGGGSKATGIQAHAENNGTTASGFASHSEGSETEAQGDLSHAEGYRTTANRRSNHVFGEYNSLDNGGTDITTKGNYIEIVGNGTVDRRSNARTLDWSGNEVLAGTIDASGFGTNLAALIPAAQVQSNWNESDTTSKAYIQNKPTIPAALSDLSDVDLTNVQNGMTLKYNSGTLKFEAGVFYIEILQADYDQLTSAQKHNGIPYFITDGHGAASLPSYVDLTDILLAGSTTLTIQSPYITTSGTYDIYTDPEVPYISKVVTTGQIVITFDEQSSDLAVKVRIT